MDSHISEQIRLTFLQVLYLLIEVPGSIEQFNEREVLINFITERIENIAKDSQQQYQQASGARAANKKEQTYQQKNAKYYEDILILLITQRLLHKHKDQEYINKIAQASVFDKIRQIAQQKQGSHMGKHCELIIFLVNNNQQYAQNMQTDWKGQQNKPIDLEKYKNWLNIEIFNPWRAKTNSSSQSKLSYEFNEVETIDKIIQQERGHKALKLPILSEQCVKPFRKDLMPE